MQKVLEIIHQSVCAALTAKTWIIMACIVTLLQEYYSNNHFTCSPVQSFFCKRSCVKAESGFYSRYFLLPMKKWWAEAHSRFQSNYAPLTGFCWWNWKALTFQIAPHHRTFLRFAFEGVAYQYTVQAIRTVSGPPHFYESAWIQLFPLWGRWESTWLVLAWWTNTSMNFSLTGCCCTVTLSVFDWKSIWPRAFCLPAIIYAHAIP